jgi:hypothetical protein
VNDWTTIPALPAALAAASPSAAAATTPNRADLVIFSTNLDGGNACVGMSNVSQAFRVANRTTALFDYPPIVLSAQLNEAQQDGRDVVMFANSMYPTCFSRAVKKTINSNPQKPIDTTQQPTKPTQPIDVESVRATSARMLHPVCD